VTKCNLSKINFVPILVSSFPNYAEGGLMPLARASYDLHKQLIPCSSSQSVFAIAFLLACHFCAFFFLNPPSLFVLGIGKYWLEQFSVIVPGESCSQGCHGYLLPSARALRGSTNLVGTSAHLN